MGRGAGYGSTVWNLLLVMWVICFQDFLQALWEVDFARAMKTLFVRPPLLLSFFVSPRLGGNLHPPLFLSRRSASISLSSPSHYSPVYRETILSLFEFTGTWWKGFRMRGVIYSRVSFVACDFSLGASLYYLLLPGDFNFNAEFKLDDFHPFLYIRWLVTFLPKHLNDTLCSKWKSQR